MKHIQTLVLILNVIVCGQFLFKRTIDLHVSKVGIQSEAVPYVEQFVATGHALNRNVQIQDLIVMFGNDAIFKPNQLAYCHMEPNQTPEVYIKSSTWVSMSQFDKRELVFHELGHCVLKLSHNDTKQANGIPVSIMTTNHNGPRIYNQYTMTQYDAELFGIQSNKGVSK